MAPLPVINFATAPDVCGSVSIAVVGTFVMQDKRCVRFASVGEMTEQELGLAIDVWLDDALKAPWATKESMKLAGVLCTYMRTDNANGISLKSIEDLYQLNADAARRSLVVFQLYGMIESSSIDGNELCAALRLSSLQALRVIEASKQLDEMQPASQAGSALRKPRECWSPGLNQSGANDTGDQCTTQRLATSVPAEEHKPFQAGETAIVTDAAPARQTFAQADTLQEFAGADASNHNATTASGKPAHSLENAYVIESQHAPHRQMPGDGQGAVADASADATVSMNLSSQQVLAQSLQRLKRHATA